MEIEIEKIEHPNGRVDVCIMVPTLEIYDQFQDTQDNEEKE